MPNETETPHVPLSEAEMANAAPCWDCRGTGEAPGHTTGARPPCGRCGGTGLEPR